MKQAKIYIDVYKLTKQTNYGRDIYEMIFPHLEEIDSARYKNILNPYYDDGNASLCIYKGKWMWQHKDFGDESFTGNALDMAALHYNLDRESQFPELLLRIATDLKIDLKELEKEVDPRVFEAGYCLNGAYNEDEEGLKAAYSYYSNYGITKEVLRWFRVRAVKHLCVIDENGKPKMQFFPKDKIVIAYEDVNHSKLYSPGEENYKFRYLGNKPSNFVFGQKEIVRRAVRTKSRVRDPLIITGGEKDVLTLTSLGYDAICLNSETANIPKDLMDGLLLAYNKVVLLYDLDDTGIRNANRLSKQHGFAVCTLPEELKSKGGKDVSDYMRLLMPVEKLREVIANCDVTASLFDVPLQVTRVESVKREISELPVDLPGTPYLPDEVYSLLPRTLKNICNLFEDRRDKDVCLLSSLTVLSSCIPNINGIYDGRRIGCNINLFITAPASAGKGVMTWSRILGMAINEHLKHKFKVEHMKYQSDLITYEAKKSEGCHNEMPEEPKEKRLFIPANSSCSSVIEYLDANQRFGIMFDNEGDTLSSIIKNDWADFSSVIRKAFHHEHVSMARRMKREHLEVEKPHLSLLLSGTRNQVAKLINSVENGLFSRFLFYDFDSEIVWKDRFGIGDDSMEKDFKMVSEQILKYWIKGEEKEAIIFLLDDEQRKFVKLYFEDKLRDMYSQYGEDIVGSIKRTCVIYYRIAIILSAIKNFEVMNLHLCKMPDKMIINDNQSNCAFLIVNTLLAHLEIVFTRLQHTGAVSNLNFKQNSLFDALPKSFTWQEFIALAGELEIGNAAAQKYRRDFMKLKLIRNNEHGQYQKV